MRCGGVKNPANVHDGYVKQEYGQYFGQIFGVASGEQRQGTEPNTKADGNDRGWYHSFDNGNLDMANMVMTPSGNKRGKGIDDHGCSGVLMVGLLRKQKGQKGYNDDGTANAQQSTGQAS